MVGGALAQEFALAQHIGAVEHAQHVCTVFRFYHVTFM